ncbi:hypothetical protein NLJ89_g7394 [Agrocybe chaxingu]|uniref:F-box domain-containing protein n=1 Tax=Agrocybe chaxingu TaxID=84603 RepID=A0A9W8JWR8_9AGAR|nr:hypothetical protein NLJ89_g7394 [Agrocybe chaxingu]
MSGFFKILTERVVPRRVLAYLWSLDAVDKISTWAGRLVGNLTLAKISSSILWADEGLKESDKAVNDTCGWVRSKCSEQVLRVRDLRPGDAQLRSNEFAQSLEQGSPLMILDRSCAWVEQLEFGTQRMAVKPKEVLHKAILTLENRRNELLRELDSISLQIQNQKAQYSQLINEDAPIHKLPNELLTEIFLDCQQISARSRNKNRSQTPFQVAASHVSRRWREAILATPLLWNTVDFHIRPMNHVQGRVLSQLGAHITRSDTCFLDVSLNFHIVDQLSSYFKLLGAHSRRWRRLSIVTKHEQVEEISELLRNAEAPILQHLSLNIGKPEQGSLSPRKPYSTVVQNILMLGAPSLSFLRLAGFALGNSHPPTSFVTTLHLDGWTRHYMAHDQFRTILENTPLLVNLSLNQLTFADPWALSILVPINTNDAIDIFDSPVLPSVQTVCLESCAFDEPEIENLIRAFPSVSYLSIDEAMPDIFFMLLPNSPETEPETEPARPCPWPHLRTLAIQDLQPVDVTPLCHLVYTRRNGPAALTKIQLDRRSRTVLQTKDRLDWLQDQLEVDRNYVPDPWPTGLGYEDVHDLLE